MDVRKVMILLTVLVLAAATAQAATGIFRFQGASIHPTGDLVTTDSETIPLGDGTTLSTVERTSIEADQALGFCLDFEARFTDRFGLGFTVMRADHDLDVSGSATVRITDDATNQVLLEMTEQVTIGSDVEMTPLLVGANFHFGPNEKVDLYAGPFVGWVTFGDVVFEGERIALEDEFTYGGAVGLDVPLGETQKMALSAALRYMVASAKPDEPNADNLDVDPLTFTFGVGYRF